MKEKHENEQYFFTASTVSRLVKTMAGYQRPCLLCAPTLAAALEEQGKPVTLLDIDLRFAGVKGFQKWDLTRPSYLATEFDLIFSDPPFFNVSLAQLFKAIRILAHFDYDRPVIISYLTRRAHAVEKAFAPFKLKRVDYFLEYQTLKKGPKNDIQLFSNVRLAGEIFAAA